MARFKVYYQDENQCSVDRPVVVRIEDGLTPEAAHQAVIARFREDYPDYEWECIENYPLPGQEV